MADGDRMPQGRKPTAGQLELVRSLPDNDKIEWPKATWTVPVEVFSEAYHQAEQAQIFNRLPIVAAPAGLLPDNGTYVCREIYGREVLFSRDEQGEVHAFLNVCMHRGSRIVTDTEVHKGRLLSCPFHAWAYDLKGRCAAVPREETFKDIDKSRFGLPKLKCRELGGLIWLKLDPEADDDFSAVPEALVQDFAALGVPTMHLFATGVHDVAANWKLVMDTFQEGYHVVRLHAESLKGRFEDSVEMIGRLGYHLRRAAGRIDYRRSMLEGREQSLEELRKLVTFHYTLIPNAVMICSQIYVNLMVFVPVSATTCRVINYMLTDRPPANEKELDRFTRSHDLTDKLTFLEDYAAAAYSQAGISTGALKEFTLCPLEQHVWSFHQTIDDLIHSRKPSPGLPPVAG